MFEGVGSVSLARSGVVIASQVGRDLFRVSTCYMDLESNGLIRYGTVKAFATLYRTGRVHLAPAFLVVTLTGRASPLCVYHQDGSTYAACRVARAFVLFRRQVTTTRGRLAHGHRRTLGLMNEATAGLSCVRELRMRAANAHRGAILSIGNRYLHGLTTMNDALKVLSTTHRTRANDNNDLDGASHLSGRVLCHWIIKM